LLKIININNVHFVNTGLKRLMDVLKYLVYVEMSFVINVEKNLDLIIYVDTFEVISYEDDKINKDLNLKLKLI
jgi:hypothetical protein